MAAQAQAVRQEAITSQESLELCKALLRVSIYHVSYLRGIFPEDNFKAVDMRNLDNMEIRMLLAKNPESQRLVNWVEGGVADALERRYLRKMFFGFSRDREGRDLLEEYVFSFSYDADGSVHMAAGGASKPGRFSTKDPAPKSAKGPTLTAVKYQVCRLMRMLVEITHTLEQVPEERYLFMKLTYTDDTPMDYEPPLFGPATDGGVGCFSRMPFSMEVGKVDTKHIKVALGVKTILDNIEDGWNEDMGVPVADDNSSLFLQTEAGGAISSRDPEPSAPGSGAAASQDGGFSCAGSGGRSGRKGEVAKQVKMEDAMSAGSAPAASAPQQPAAPAAAEAAQPSERDLEAVRSWVLSRAMPEVHALDALARFGSIDAACLDACFAALQREGVLQATDQADCYRVNKPEANNQQAAAEDAAVQAMQQLTVQAPDSCRGGVHDNGGSQRTMSCVGGGGKRKAAPQREESEAPVERFLDTQQASMAAGPGRRGAKASMVTDPINQTAKRARRGKKEPAAAPVAPTRRTTRRGGAK